MFTLFSQIPLPPTFFGFLMITPAAVHRFSRFLSIPDVFPSQQFIDFLVSLNFR